MTHTISAVSPGSINLTLTSLGGWSGVVDLTCGGLPSYAQCKTFPGQPNITASTAAGITLPTQFTLSVLTNVQPLPPTATGLWWVTAGFCGVLLLLARRRRSLPALAGRALGFLGFALLLAGSMTGLSACSSSSNSTSTAVTPTGSSAITVTVQGAQLTSSTATTTQAPDLPFTFTFNLTVQ